jgi:hypothetical protein
MITRIALLSLLLPMSDIGLYAQEAPARGEEKEKPPVTIAEIRPVLAASGSGQWTKVLVTFNSDPKWLDGMQLSVTALVGDGTQDRPYSVLTGLVRYINVPKGQNTGVLYISPNTTKRYGGVAAATADIYLNDRVVSSLEWAGGGKKPPENWQGVYDRRDGALLPITSTPWVATEYDKYPDLVGGR